MKFPLRNLLFSAGIAVVAARASAIAVDQAKVVINKLEGNTRLSIQFSGASVSMIEMRLNGVSIGSTKFATAKVVGDVTFGLDPDALHDGDNAVEIRLFDGIGNLVGVEKTTITTDAASGPVHLAMPKMGATVQGPVEIKVGFGREMKNVYVSFFVDNQFRSMTNSSPYTYVWDTQTDANGWHEVEAWVVDETSSTFKTRKTKVFVNNPGGRTNRVLPKTTPADVRPVNNSGTAAVGAAAGVKTGPIQGAQATIEAAHLAPKLAVGATVKNPARSPELGKPAPVRATIPQNGISAGSRLTTPQLPKVVVAQKTTTIPNLPKVSPAVVVGKTGAAPIAITKGRRLPDFGNFSILWNTSIVSFDVAPRVENGIPLTPFRHLFEKSGGKVKWDNDAKAVDAKGEGREITLRIGDKTARVNKLAVEMEIAPFLERGRTVVPLSFIRDALGVEVEYDPKTGHVLITNKK